MLLYENRWTGQRILTCEYGFLAYPIADRRHPHVVDRV